MVGQSVVLSHTYGKYFPFCVASRFLEEFWCERGRREFAGCCMYRLCKDKTRTCSDNISAKDTVIFTKENRNKETRQQLWKWCRSYLLSNAKKKRLLMLRVGS